MYDRHVPVCQFWRLGPERWRLELTFSFSSRLRTQADRYTSRLWSMASCEYTPS